MRGTVGLVLVLSLAVTRTPDPTFRLLIATGFLGAYTTFSTFAVEAVNLIRDDRIVAAATYVATSAGLGLLAAAAGIEVAQRYAR